MKLSLVRIAAVAAKEFRHLRRDRLSGAMIIGIPVVMTLLFGYAINTDVRDLPAAVADQADTTASRALTAAVQASGVVRIVERVRDPATLERRLGDGSIVVGLFLPSDFEQRLADGRPVGQLLVDGSDPVVQNAARALTQAPLDALLERVRPVPAAAGTGALPQSALAVRAYYNPERRSPVFIVPGLCGVILTLTMVLFTAVAIVRERERGNLELLITTPVGSLELMAGKIVPYVVVGYLQVSLILGIGVVLFDLPVRGSMMDFYGGAGLFVLSILTLGLLISTLAATQFQAFQMTFMSFLPQLLLSGFMFPFDGMPRPAQLLAEVFPLTHFLRIVRGVVLRDADLALMADDLWPLLAFFVVVMALATARFRKRLD
jgi:ABC-2 type transport system permease protein